MFRLAWYADIPDPDNVLSPLLHSTSPTNRTFYRNPRVDQLLEQARKAFDEGSGSRSTARWSASSWTMPHGLPSTTTSSEYLYQPYVQGVEVSLLGRRAIPMKRIWFKKSLAEGSTGATTDVRPSR